MPFLDSHQWIANQFRRIEILAWSRKLGMVDWCNSREFGWRWKEVYCKKFTHNVLTCVQIVSMPLLWHAHELAERVCCVVCLMMATLPNCATIVSGKGLSLMRTVTGICEFWSFAMCAAVCAHTPLEEQIAPHFPALNTKSSRSARTFSRSCLTARGSTGRCPS